MHATTYLVLAYRTALDMERDLALMRTDRILASLAETMTGDNIEVFNNPSLCVVFAQPTTTLHQLASQFSALLTNRGLPTATQCQVRTVGLKHIVGLLTAKGGSHIVNFITLESASEIAHSDLLGLLWDAQMVLPSMGYVPRVKNSLWTLSPYTFWLILVNVWRIITTLPSMFGPLHWVLRTMGLLPSHWVMNAALIPPIKRLRYAMRGEMASASGEHLAIMPALLTYEELLDPAHGYERSCMLKATAITLHTTTTQKTTSAPPPIAQLMVQSMEFLLLHAITYATIQLLTVLVLTVTQSRLSAFFTVLLLEKKLQVAPHLVGLNVVITHLLLAWFFVAYWNKYIRATNNSNTRRWSDEFREGGFIGVLFMLTSLFASTLSTFVILPLNVLLNMALTIYHKFL